MILSCRGERYGRLDTLNVKIRPLFQNLLAFLMEAKNGKKSEERNGGTRRNTEERNLIHIEEDKIICLEIDRCKWQGPELQ